MAFRKENPAEYFDVLIADFEPSLLEDRKDTTIPPVIHQASGRKSRWGLEATQTTTGWNEGKVISFNKRVDPNNPNSDYIRVGNIDLINGTYDDWIRMVDTNYSNQPVVADSGYAHLLIREPNPMGEKPPKPGNGPVSGLEGTLMSIRHLFFVGSIIFLRQIRNENRYLLLPVLVFLFFTHSAVAQLEVRPSRNSDIDLFHHRVSIPFDFFSNLEMEPVPQTSEIFAAFGLRMDSLMGNYVRFGYYRYDSSFSPTNYIENASKTDSSVNKPFLLRFRFPVRIVALCLGADYYEHKTVSANIRAYTPSGDLIGEQNAVEVIPRVPYRNYFFISSSHPEGIASLVIDYGNDTRPERIEIALDLDYLESRPFRLYLPHFVDGKSGDISLKTTIRAQKSYWDQDIALRFYDPSGKATTVSINGEKKSEILLSGGPKGQIVQTDGLEPQLKTGWVMAESTYPIDIQTVYTTISSTSEPITESACAAVRSRFRQTYTVHRNVSRGLDTAFAIVNVSDRQNDVELSGGGDKEKYATEIAAVLHLKPGEQRAFFLSEVCRLNTVVYCTLEEVFQGSLTISGRYPVAVIALGSVNGTLTYPMPCVSTED